MHNEPLDKLKTILAAYKNSFTSKDYGNENDDRDILMDVFGLTPELKRENRQYWGRELGMCWQLLVSALFEITTVDWAAGYRVDKDELCDLRAGMDAIDTKYRIGSGDSGTLKKFRSYAQRLREQKYTPILLILRKDNLDAAIAACRDGGWEIKQGDESLDYIKIKTGVDLAVWLNQQGSEFLVERQALSQAANLTKDGLDLFRNIPD